jgi:hypothetical protein
MADPEQSVARADAIKGAAFYCATDARGFLGTVGLVNSLRRVGHDEPILILDCGLEHQQRALLEPHATVMPAPPDVHPALLKTVLPLARPADVMVLVDIDVIVLQHLGALLDLAASGQFVTFENDQDRYFPEWGELLGLGTVPRRRYVASGHLILPGPASIPLLREFDEIVERVGLTGALTRGGIPRAGAPEDPLFFTDMDIFNAVLAARIPDDRFTVLEYRLAPFPPFAGLTVHPERFECVDADGMQPFLLHHALSKPWLAAVRNSVYAELLSRLLLGDEHAIGVSRASVPLRLRAGRLARADRARAQAQAILREKTRGRLGIRPRLQTALARISARA